MTFINQSAGILAYRRNIGQLEFLLVHPGGPFYKFRDLGVWSIPKGRIESGENPESAARREFYEETGLLVTQNLTAMAPVVLKSGKIIHAFSLQQDFDLTDFHSNTFKLLGIDYPEVDRSAWFNKFSALRKIHPAQASFLCQIE